MEVFNEICTLFLSLLMIFFTDSVEDINSKYVASYLFIIIYIGSALINLIVITAKNLRDLRFNIKKFIWKKKVQLIKIRSTFIIF